jgi:acetylcholinesterase
MLGLLLLPLLARAAPSVSSVGAIDLLSQLNADGSSSTGALLLYQSASSTRASALCQQLNEALLGSAATAGIADSINYARSSGNLQQGERLWLSNGAPSRIRARQSTCQAYDVDQRATVAVDCQTSLRSLCTSSAPATTWSNWSLQPTDSSLVENKAGDLTLLGFRDTKTFRFLGIPFAKPPTGQLRFQQPQAYDGAKTLNATRYGASCIQVRGGFGPGNFANCACLHS